MLSAALRPRLHGLAERLQLACGVGEAALGQAGVRNRGVGARMGRRYRHMHGLVHSRRRSQRETARRAPVVNAPIDIAS